MVAPYGLGMSNLGWCYAKGIGVQDDAEQAVHWYRKGAEAGDGGGMSNMGVCYANGIGVEADAEQSYSKGGR